MAYAARAMATAEADTVAPLLRLTREIHEAHHVALFARALELSERALADAEATMPHDSLVVAYLVGTVICSRTAFTQNVAAAAQTPGYEDALTAAWARDEQALALAQRCLALLHARWRAGAVFSLVTPEEAAFFDGWKEKKTSKKTGKKKKKRAPSYPGADVYIACARDAALYWPALHMPAEEEARVRGVHGALCAALELQARSGLDHLRTSTLSALHNLLLSSLSTSSPCGLLQQLRSVCGLTPAAEYALRLTQKHTAALGQTTANGIELLKFIQERGAEDVAHHGLRRCALPACAATEAHPKLFKLCGRCRGAAYCCAAHAAEDWKRHKREDGCKAAS